MEKLFANKVAFITSGAAGMGLAAVKAFAEECAAVWDPLRRSPMRSFGCAVRRRALSPAKQLPSTADTPRANSSMSSCIEPADATCSRALPPCLQLCVAVRVVSGKEKNIMDSKHLPKGVLTDDEVRSVSPALENYTKTALLKRSVDKRNLESFLL